MRVSQTVGRGETFVYLESQRIDFINVTRNSEGEGRGGEGEGEGRGGEEGRKERRVRGGEARGLCPLCQSVLEDSVALAQCNV